jgi:apolipoprotein N-acyltransferase
MDFRRLALAGLSSVLLASAFPRLDWWPAAWFALVPLFWATKDRTPREAAILGWIAGTLHYGLALYWLVYTIRAYGGLPLILALPVVLLLVLYLGAFWALFCAVGAHIRSTLGIDFIWVAPPLWCATELLRNFLISGFPWGLLGYSQWRVTSLIQVADLTGVYGISFLLVLTNAALVVVIQTISQIGPRHKGKAACALGISVLLVGSSLLYGRWRAPRIMTVSDVSSLISVGIAQGNIEQSLKWEPAFREETFRIYQQLTTEMVRDGAVLVIWPETAAPFFYEVEEAWRTRLKLLASMTKTEILFGAPAVGKREGRQTLFNRAYLMGPEGDIRGYYDKMHLVPFGEYVPFKGILFFVNRMVESIGDYSPGEAPMTLLSRTGASIGTMICFESIFPEISRALVRNGADILANLTNDAWFGDTSAPYQHLSMLTVRAVENRRWIVRAANTGISCFVDPCGRVRSEISLFRRGREVDKVPRLQIESFYSKQGDLFSVACSLWSSGLLILSVSLSVIKRRRHNAPPRMERRTS